MNREKWIKELALLAIGNLIVVLGVEIFILPFSILSGGVAGIAVALKPVIPHISEETIITIVYMVTLILGIVFLGKDFGIKTIISSILFPTYVLLLSNLNVSLDITNELASVYGGIITGFGMSIVLRTGASTGGMDVPPLILHKLTGIKFSVLLFFIDGLTVILGLSTRGIEAVLIGMITVFVNSYTINKLLVLGGHHAKTIHVISEKYEEILDMIHQSLDRGATILEAYGGYSKQHRPVILTVITNNQYSQLHDSIHEIDPEAFLIVADATEIKGRGFSFDYKI